MTLARIPELYARQDALTDPGHFAHLYDDLPDDPSALRDIVSGLIAHVSWAARYETSPDTPMLRETQPVADRLRLTEAAFAGSLSAQRLPRQRTFGTCRDYSLMLCSMLRQRSIPARVRCGFATYFSAGAFQDHWICEHWSQQETRWIRADAQLDQLQQDELGITFNCADLPDAAFLTAGAAWTLARTGGAAPDDFGHGEAKGLWFLQVNLHRDLFALTNQHMSAWDTWRDATARSKSLDDADVTAGDHLAHVIEAADRTANGIAELRAMAAGCQIPPWQT